MKLIVVQVKGVYPILGVVPQVFPLTELTRTKHLHPLYLRVPGNHFMAVSMVTLGLLGAG